MKSTTKGSKKSTPVAKKKSTTKSCKPSKSFARQQWEKRFNALSRFKAKHGHLNYLTLNQNARLYRWLLVQRASERNGKLLQERKERLESLGVDLEAKNLKWRHRFEELKQYNAKHGTCEVQVCANQKEAKALRQWVYLQRIANNSGKLTGDQIQQLESINFTWKGTRGAQELSNKILTSTLFEICEITALCLATLVERPIHSLRAKALTQVLVEIWLRSQMRIS